MCFKNPLCSPPSSLTPSLQFVETIRETLGRLKHDPVPTIVVNTEFLAQLLADIPNVLPTPITTPNPHLTCQWVSPNDPFLICGAPLDQDPRLVCDHFRHAHDVRGNEKAHVSCHWGDCHVPPMLRGSLIRHVLAVHLGLLRWQCEACGKVFSRKGTGHACTEGG